MFFELGGDGDDRTDRDDVIVGIELLQSLIVPDCAAIWVDPHVVLHRADYADAARQDIVNEDGVSCGAAGTRDHASVVDKDELAVYIDERWVASIRQVDRKEKRIYRHHYFTGGVWTD